MTAYVIARVEVTDRQRYKKYLELTPATIAKSKVNPPALPVRIYMALPF